MQLYVDDPLKSFLFSVFLVRKLPYKNMPQYNSKQGNYASNWL